MTAHPKQEKSLKVSQSLASGCLNLAPSRIRFCTSLIWLLFTLLLYVIWILYLTIFLCIYIASSSLVAPPMVNNF